MKTEPKIYSEAELAAFVHQARIETHNGICEHINTVHAAHNETVEKLHSDYQTQMADVARAHHGVLARLGGRIKKRKRNGRAASMTQ